MLAEPASSLMMSSAPQIYSIDDYADSMFRFERLHPRWIESCADYLRHLFGDDIKKKVFLDYAFGRGNWSLAALRAGASRVVAIDAAESNVRRFSEYCRAQEITEIDIVHGNILKAPIDARVDVLWIYGILPCIDDTKAFLGKLSLLRRDDKAVALLYAYDRGSFREIIVEAARRGASYVNEQEFNDSSLLFTPQARLRARDDLTAPLVTWFTATEFAKVAQCNGFAVRRQEADFQRWRTGVVSNEFSPHHLLCGFGDAVAEPIVEPKRPYAGDLGVIAAIAEAVFARATPTQRRNLAVGLFNTHFTALPTDGSIETPLIADFLFLMHAALRINVSGSAVGEIAAPYHTAAMAAMIDALREFSPTQLATSPIARYLVANTLRF